MSNYFKVLLFSGLAIVAVFAVWWGMDSFVTIAEAEAQGNYLQCGPSTASSITIRYGFQDGEHMGLYRRNGTSLNYIQGLGSGSKSGEFTNVRLTPNTSYNYYLRSNLSGAPIVAAVICRTDSGTPEEYTDCPTGDASATLSCHSSTDTSVTLSYSYRNGSNVTLYRGNDFVSSLGGGTDSGTTTVGSLQPSTSYNFVLRNLPSHAALILATASCGTTGAEDRAPDEASGSLAVRSTGPSSVSLDYSYRDGFQVSLFRGNTRLTTFGSGSYTSSPGLPYTDWQLASNTTYTYYLRNGASPSAELLAQVTATTIDTTCPDDPSDPEDPEEPDDPEDPEDPDISDPDPKDPDPETPEIPEIPEAPEIPEEPIVIDLPKCPFNASPGIWGSPYDDWLNVRSVESPPASPLGSEAEWGTVKARIGTDSAVAHLSGVEYDIGVDLGGVAVQRLIETGTSPHAWFQSSKPDAVFTQTDTRFCKIGDQAENVPSCPFDGGREGLVYITHAELKGWSADIDDWCPISGLGGCGIRWNDEGETRLFGDNRVSTTVFYNGECRSGSDPAKCNICINIPEARVVSEDPSDSEDPPSLDKPEEAPSVPSDPSCPDEPEEKPAVSQPFDPPAIELPHAQPQTEPEIRDNIASLRLYLISILRALIESLQLQLQVQL